MDIQTFDEEITKTGIYSKQTQEKTSEALRNFSKEDLVKNLGELADFKEDVEVQSTREDFQKKILRTNMVIDSMFPDGLMFLIMDGWKRSLRDAVSNGNGTKRGVGVAATTACSKRQFKTLKEVFHALGILLRCCVTEEIDLELAFKENINNSEVII